MLVEAHHAEHRTSCLGQVTDGVAWRLGGGGHSVWLAARRAVDEHAFALKHGTAQHTLQLTYELAREVEVEHARLVMNGRGGRR